MADLVALLFLLNPCCMNRLMAIELVLLKKFVPGSRLISLDVTRTRRRDRKVEVSQNPVGSNRQKLNGGVHLQNLWPRFYFLFRPLPTSFFFVFVFSTASQYINHKNCRWLDLNQGPLEIDATALPTEPQPLLQYGFKFQKVFHLPYIGWC